MNGAQVLLDTLVANGVQVCFANPGTSEMQFVAAVDAVPEMRAILALFEGVATGAADGYGRMTGKPAATLLHLGPGLGNGIANLHNARRARTPLVNIVGDHATYHKRYDPPLESDIESLAMPVSGWYGSPQRVADLAAGATDAVRAALGPPGQVATLVVPADLTWTEVGQDAVTRPAGAVSTGRGANDATTGAIRESKPLQVPEDDVERIAKLLRGGEPVMLLLGGTAVHERGLAAASRVARRTGARLLCETFPANMVRGAGMPGVERLAYLAELAMAQLEGVRHLVLADAKAPVSFFAYPGKPSSLVPDGCQVHVLATSGHDVPGALEHLASLLGTTGDEPEHHLAIRPERPVGPLTASALGAAIGAVLPEGAIVSDEGNTAGLFVYQETAGAPPHNWLCLTGGAIGQGLPVATGAAVACPDRPVVCLEADGSAMYTPQALWTQAREGLNVTTVVLANHAYAVLEMELARVGAGTAGPRASSMLDIGNPDMDFVALARGMGVDSSRASTAEELVEALERAFGEPGPHLVEAVMPRGLG